MSLSHFWYACSRGHCWQAQTATGEPTLDIRHCPVCGEQGETMIDARAQTRAMFGGDTLPPPPGPQRTHGRSVPDKQSAATDSRGLLAPAQQTDELGRLGAYRVLSVLGAGGMGTVFEAEDTRTSRRVALKVMRPDYAATKTAHARFLREARAMACLEHDHVVKVHEVGEDRGIPYLAMELLRGETLRDRAGRDGTLDVAEVLRIGRETAAGLAAAHAQGLFHRDIKPDNLWLEQRDSELLPPQANARVKILDFGLAFFEDDEVRMTERGQILGTLHFMAPEQVGDAVDHRCDLFSLGCVLYYLATGCLPFANTGAKSVLVALTSATPRAPAVVNPSLPAGVSALIMKLLEKDPAARYQTAADVASAIDRLERTPDAEPEAPTSPPSLSQKFAKLLRSLSPATRNKSPETGPIGPSR